MVLAIYRTSIFALIPLQFWKWCYWFLLHNFFCDSGGGGCDSRHRYWDGHLPIYQIMLLIARPKALQKVFPFTWLGAALGSWKCDDGVHWLFGIANLEAGTSVNLLQKNLKTQKTERWSARTLLMGVLHWYWWTHKWWRNNSFWLPKVALITDLDHLIGRDTNQMESTLIVWKRSFDQVQFLLRGDGGALQMNSSGQWDCWGSQFGVGHGPKMGIEKRGPRPQSGIGTPLPKYDATNKEAPLFIITQSCIW